MRVVDVVLRHGSGVVKVKNNQTTTCDWCCVPGAHWTLATTASAPSTSSDRVLTRTNAPAELRQASRARAKEAKVAK